MIAALLVFVAGWASQRGSTCAVAAVEELVNTRRAGRLTGFLFCAVLAFTVYSAARVAGVPVTMRVPGSALSAQSMVAGALFGLGARVNGRCAMGTMARLCSGELARVGTIAGFLLGACLIIRVGWHPRMGMIESVEAKLNPLAALLLGLGVAGGLGLATTRTTLKVVGEWSPLHAMFIIGLASGVLLLLARGWPYTGVLIRLAEGQMLMNGATLLLALFVTGAATAAVASRSFALVTGNSVAWAKSLGGGVLMGMAAALLPGGNDTMLLVGLPLLLPHLVAAYVVMLLAIAVLTLAAKAN